MCSSRNPNEMFLTQHVVTAFIQLIRNKTRKVYAKILAGCGWEAKPPQPAVLRGALPAGGISVSPQVELTTTASPPCC